MRPPHTGQFAIWAAILFSAAFPAPQPAAGATIPDGNLIVGVSESTRLAYLAEYTVSGSRVQVLADLPPRPGSGSSSEARDLIVGPDNAIYVYNGSAALDRLDVETMTWTRETFPGWSTRKTSSGGLDQLGQYVFATDMNDPFAVLQGVVRFDLSGGPTVRFAEAIEPLDLSIGPNNVLYALDGSASVNDAVFKFDALTFEALGIVPIQSGTNSALAVALDGSIFVGSLGGTISRYSPDGELLASLLVPNARFADIDIDPFGRIALGTAVSGEVVTTDLSLDAFTRFRVNVGPIGTSVSVAWAPIPEPGALYVCLGLLMVSASRRRKSGPANGRNS